MAVKTDQMTSLERVGTALAHKEADRVPVAPLASGAARRVLGVTYAEYAQDAELAAQSQMQWVELTGSDAVCTFLDLSVEAADFGQEVKFPIEDTPQAVFRNPVIKNTDDYGRIPLINPRKTKRMSMNLRYLELMVNALGKEKAVLGFIYGPLSTLSQMRSAEKLFLDCMKEPDKVHEGVEIVTQVLLDYVDAQVDRGAIGIVMDTLFCSGSIMSRDLWMKMEGPYVERIAKRIHDAGLAIMIHNCGNNPYFDVQIETMKPEAISIAYLPDECPTYADLKKTWGDKVTIVGLIAPSQVMYMGAPADVKEACKEQIQALAPGGGYLLSTGCEFPPNASLLNAIAMVEAAEEYGQYPIA
ncbi:MAG: uroporphyrinogen decarboxylase family protein [Thermoleophilia bacterium]